MSVLIRGMEMPKEDIITLMIFPDGNVRIWGTDINPDEWAEAIEVPPHGDLIDRDEIQYANNTTFDEDYVRRKTIMKMPTIIGAED